MTMRLSTEVHVMPFRDPFRIARAEDDRAATTVVVELEMDGGLAGVGEAFPTTYYGETPATVAAVLPHLAASLEGIGSAPTSVTEARTWLADAEIGRAHV